jgi:MSHA biogenesis protein MshI
MQWPWKRARSQDQLIVSWSAQDLAFVHATQTAGRFIIHRMGAVPQGADSPKAFAERLGAMGLAGHPAMAMLVTDQCMLLQIAAPAVPPEELRSAARYQIRDMVDMHIDDLTLDVLRLGDGQDKSMGQVFVVAAANTVIKETLQLAASMDWPVQVIDVQEMAQRNLQAAWALADGLAERATAALMVVNDHQALLTIVARGELYYTRRLDLPPGFMAMQWRGALGLEAAPVDAYTPVDEYVPDYGRAALGLGMDGVADANADRAQRVLVELQRSLDLWDRTWTNLPLASVNVYAAGRTAELADWLRQGLGQTVTSRDPTSLFEGVPELSEEHKLRCLPLLGLLLRSGDVS